jgi:hypothetical protein
MILKDSQKRTWIMDSKFIGKTFRDYESLELDAQIGTYQWAAIQEGYNALGFLFNQILTRIPEPPKQNKTKNKFGGYTSVADIVSDWETYRLAAIGNGEEHLLEKYYEEMTPKLETKTFFDRKQIYRSDVEIENFYQDLKLRIEDLDRAKELIYRQPDKFKCMFCDFRRRYELLRDDEFQPKRKEIRGELIWIYYRHYFIEQVKTLII